MTRHQLLKDSVPGYSPSFLNLDTCADCVDLAPVRIDLGYACCFLDALEPGGLFTFQTFDDDKRRHRPDLVKVIHSRNLFEVAPRLTVATNVLPKFKDRTDGLWRRMLYLPFKIQIRDESKQDRRLVDPSWWRGSGELPGIFNWALDGLKRLREQGCFTESRSSLAAKTEFRRECNSAATFLEEQCEQADGLVITTQELYQAYNVFSAEVGVEPMGKQAFGKEVTRLFPSVKSSPNALWHGGKRDRVWKGLRLFSG